MRTVPTPSQPTTPFAGKLLPGEVRAPLREEKKGAVGAKVARGVVGQEEATEQNLAAEEDNKEVVKEHEQGSGVVPDLVPQIEQQDGETDSLKDLNIVTVSEAQCSDAAARTDTLGALDMRVESPEDALASPPDTRMESPDALDGKPDTPPESQDTVSLPEAPSSEPDSPLTQVRTRVVSDRSPY